jgi:hypothetical protein
LPDWVPLLVKLGEPCDRTLWGAPPGGMLPSDSPVPVQVQVTICPTGTVSRAGLRVPLWPLSKKMLPTFTDPIGPPPPPLPPSLGLVLLEHPIAAAAAAASIQVRVPRMCSPPENSRPPRAMACCPSCPAREARSPYLLSQISSKHICGASVQA